MPALAVVTLLGFIAAAYWLGRRRALAVSCGEPRALHSRPTYYGNYVALWCGTPMALLLLLSWWIGPVVQAELVSAQLPAATRALPPEALEIFLNNAKALAEGAPVFGAVEDATLQRAALHWNEIGRVFNAALLVLMLALGGAGLAWARARIAPQMRARVAVERAIRAALAISSAVAVFTTIGIVLSVVFEALRFFALVPVSDFLFGTVWSPQTAIRADQVGSSGAFGAVPLFTGTLMITAIAMLVAAPVGLFSAIYLGEYAGARMRRFAKPVLEILAGIPTVVYGFFAALTVAPFIRDLGGVIGLDVKSESALVAGLVMGVMIIPFVSSLSDDIITAVPQSLREGSLGLGATRSETVRKVVLPAALPGIVGALLLAVSRAIGETMIVYMAAGQGANLSWNPLDATTTVTVQIVALLTGDQEFDSAKTLSAFALGLVLFIVTLALNLIALGIVRRYREQYE